MDTKKAIRNKLIAVGVLTLVLIGLGIAYSRSFFDADKAELIKKRYAQFESIGLSMPEHCKMIDGRLQGSPRPYGIDARLVTVLDITGMGGGDSLEDSKEAVKTYYAEALRAWHPGFLELGKSGTARTVYGPAGLALIEVNAFWYGDAVQGNLGKQTAEIILGKVKPEEGQGHRYALINIIICTRP